VRVFAYPGGAKPVRFCLATRAEVLRLQCIARFDREQTLERGSVAVALFVVAGATRVRRKVDRARVPACIES
jgi:hypothetical protein